MKIALVHDYLNEAGGAERVLRVLSDMYPEAPIYTAFVKEGTARQMFSGRKIKVSKWGWILRMGRMYSYLRFALPWIWKSVDLSDYELVITSCSGYIARGFGVGKRTRVIAYCHTPPRWLYYYDTPTGAQNRWWGKVFMWLVGPWVRYFDYQSAQRVDTWIANSQEVARRIEKFYRKKATVVYPPVSMVNGQWSMVNGEHGYYLAVARVTGAKGLVEAAKAAQKLGFRLKIVGETVGTQTAQELAGMGKGVEMMGRVSDEALSRLYGGAKGYIALARDEDLGMTVVEAMAQGTPVLAYYGGGYRETVKEGETGIFVRETSVEVIAEGIKKMEATNWDRVKIKKWAKTFNRAKFEKGIREAVGA